MKTLIVVDPQNDFMPNGNLAVANGNEIVPIINRIMPKFDLVIFTQDWHPANHKSFASQHEGKSEFQVIKLNGIDQVLWPDHCVQNTKGSEFHEDLKIPDNNFYIFKKGLDVEVDSYSGFFDNDKKSSTGLSEFLKEKCVTDVHICGLATDFCVKFTALDAINEKFNTILLSDVCRGLAEDIKPILEEMIDSGVDVTTTEELNL